MEMITAIANIPFKITGSVADPRDIDYNIKGYFKKRTVVKGELRTIEYYESYDFSGNTYNNLILRESRLFTRDALGIVKSRNMTIEWFLIDDTVGVTKQQMKYYSQDEEIQEGLDRRNNMISAAKLKLLSELKAVFGEPTNQNYAFDLLLSVSTQMNYYKEGYTQPLRDAINASTKPYLTQTIKDNVNIELTF